MSILRTLAVGGGADPGPPVGPPWTDYFNNAPTGVVALVNRSPTTVGGADAGWNYEVVERATNPGPDGPEIAVAAYDSEACGAVRTNTADQQRVHWLTPEIGANQYVEFELFGTSNTDAWCLGIKLPGTEASVANNHMCGIRCLGSNLVLVQNFAFFDSGDTVPIVADNRYRAENVGNEVRLWNLSNPSLYRVGTLTESSVQNATRAGFAYSEFSNKPDRWKACVWGVGSGSFPQ